MVWTHEKLNHKKWAPWCMAVEMGLHTMSFCNEYHTTCDTVMYIFLLMVAIKEHKLQTGNAMGNILAFLTDKKLSPTKKSTSN